jgi:hypothetical protein
MWDALKSVAAAALVMKFIPTSKQTRIAHILVDDGLGLTTHQTLTLLFSKADN